jgi:hypothetical protein
MHQGALGVQNEIGSSCVLVDLIGLMLTTLGALVARLKSPLAAVHSRSRKRHLTKSRQSMAALCFYSPLRGGSREVI